MKYRAQSAYVAVLLGLSVLSTYFSMLALHHQLTPLYVALATLFGVSVFPLNPLAMELMTRKFPTVPNYIMNTLIVFLSQVFSTLVTLPASLASSNLNGSIYVAVVMVMLTLCMPFLPEVDSEIVS